VTAEHDDYPTLLAMRLYYRGDDRSEISRNQNIGKRPQKCGERTVVARRRREFLGANLVGTALYRNGSDLRQVRFGKIIARRRRLSL
jgi:hypothetical protein